MIYLVMVAKVTYSDNTEEFIEAYTWRGLVRQIGNTAKKIEIINEYVYDDENEKGN